MCQKVSFACPDRRATVRGRHRWGTSPDPVQSAQDPGLAIVPSSPRCLTMASGRRLQTSDGGRSLCRPIGIAAVQPRFIGSHGRSKPAEHRGRAKRGRPLREGGNRSALSFSAGTIMKQHCDREVRNRLFDGLTRLASTAPSPVGNERHRRRAPVRPDRRPNARWHRGVARSCRTGLE